MDTSTNGARILGIIASAVVGIAAQYGLTLNPAEITTIMIATYAFVHRLVSKKTNPADAATKPLATEGKIENHRLTPNYPK